MKKEQPQDAEDNNQLDDNKNPKLLSPRHSLKAVPIKTHYLLEFFEHDIHCFDRKGTNIFSHMQGNRKNSCFLRKVLFVFEYRTYSSISHSP